MKFTLYSTLKTTLFICLFSTISLAQKISFDTYGYPTETIIKGVKGSSVLYVPVEENLNFLNSYAYLEFSTSQVIEKNKSHITVLLNDIPIETRLLKNENHIVSFQIPLPFINFNHAV